MVKLYDKGFTFSWAGLCFEKLGDSEWDWWVCTNGTYLVEVYNEQTKEMKYHLHPESEKPLYDKNKKLNRFGFKWTDEQVKQYYYL